MKQIFTLLIAGILCQATNAQLLLNEIYTDPGNGKSEFFELFNPDPSPEQTDNYTLVTYYKSPTKKGFYVLDMPAATVAGKGFYVGSAYKPFDYQGVTDAGTTNFSWNDQAYLESNGGSLTRWEYNNGIDQNTADGNTGYDFNKVVSTNDFFARVNGAGSSFVVFLYKNGMFVNSAILGSGGSTSLSADILSMPPLFVDMQGSSPDFTFNFSTYTNLPVEAVGQEAGSDNGFIREFDGACGAWTKSSSQANHTPLISNGTKSIYAAGTVDVAASIIIGNESSGSIVSYNVGSVPASLLPLTLSFYVDNGSLYNQLDVNDSLLTKQIVTSSGSNYTLNFKPYDRNVIMVVKASAGCVDFTKLVASLFMSTLPVRLVQFNAVTKENRAVLNWSVANNEDGKYYEVQSSINGSHFQAAAVITTTSKNGSETYSHKETKELTTAVFYRLKLVDKNNNIAYSSVVKLLVEQGKTASPLQLLQNPVSSQVRFTVNTEMDEKTIFNVYNMLGGKVSSTQLYLKKGINAGSISLDGNMQAGSYLLEMVSGSKRSIVKFIKY